MMRYPERSEGSPGSGTVPNYGDPSLHSGGRTLGYVSEWATGPKI